MSHMSEFKEKPFEKYFCAELARKTNVMYSPDQCDEAFLGFDDAFFLRLPDLVPWLPYMRRSRRHRLSGVSPRELDGFAEEVIRRAPPFKFNVFLQYKRPEYIDHHRGKEWPCWEGPYYRFDTTPHQQDLLARLESKSAGRAAVVYASAAFWRNADLYTHAKNGTVIENSNIANVARLIGHGRFSYDSPGTFGYAHSDPVGIESTSLDQIIEDGLQQEGLPLNRHIRRLARAIKLAIEPDEGLVQMHDKAKQVLLGDFLDGPAETRGGSFLFALATVVAFCELADLSLYAMG